MSREKRVIITGNKGYISRNLEKYLTKNGYTVGGFDIKEGVDAATFSLPKKHGITAIIHLAAIAGVNECEKNIEAAVKNNIIAASNIFQLSIENDIQVIFASSQAAKNHNSVYGSTKKYAECYAKFFNTMGGKIRVLRLCNVYGGEGYFEDKDSVVARFVRAKKEGEKAIIHGQGNQTRDFIHIDDVCEAIYLSIYNTRDMDEVLDVGTGRETSVLELANILGCDISFDEKYKAIGVTRSAANIKLTEDLLGYRPKVSLEEFAKNLG
jgi:UDP-glucose 4-epimerase